MNCNLNKYKNLEEKCYIKKLGRVVKLVGLTIEALGPNANLNDLCIITSKENPNQTVRAEVVGFRDKKVLLMPYGNVEGIGPGAIVENTGAPLLVPVGEEMLGQVLDGLGNLLDGDAPLTKQGYSAEADPPDPIDRKSVV